MGGIAIRLLVVVLALAILATGCILPAQPVPTVEPATTAVLHPTATPAPTTDPAPTAATPRQAAGPNGRVLWNGEPVPGARLKLAKPGTCPDNAQDTVLATATADAKGQFAFAAAPTTEWELCAAWPSGQAPDSFQWVRLESGQPPDGVSVKLVKPLQLLAPDVSQPVAGSFEIRWESVPGAATYRVVVGDPGTGELILQQDLPGTSLVVTPVLKPGHGYTLSVDGTNASQEQIARYSGQFQTPGVPPAPGNEAVVQLPVTCYRAGLLTYVDRASRLCFAYPQGFRMNTHSGSQALAEIRGPAIGSGPEPLFANVSVEFRPYQGQDLAPFVDEMIKTSVPAEFTAKVERKQLTLAGHAAELLEPVPGRLSSRVLVIDAAPQGFHILTFWPSFRDTPASQTTQDAQQAQRDMDALYETVASTLATLPPPGVPIDPSARLDLPKSCVVAGQPLYVNTSDRYCLALTPQMAAFREPGGTAFYGPALDQSPDPARVGLSLTAEVAAKDSELDPLAGNYIASYKDLASSIGRSALTLGGQPAVRLDGVPGRPSAVELLMLHDGTLFQFRFTPEPGTADANGDASALIQAVAGSFGFLPGTAGTGATAESNVAASTATPREGSQPYEGVSFAAPRALSLTADGQIVPAEGGSDGPWWATSPKHVEIGLAGYPAGKTVQAPQILVYPAAEFAAMNPEAAKRIAGLQELLKTKPANPEGELPFLPLFNAKQMLHLRVKYLPFEGGEGVSYLTQYAQGLVPLNSQELVYTFQGLTGDGKYYVAAILPVSHHLLPAGSDSVTAADREALAKDYASYLKDASTKLSQQEDASFQPDLSALDTLVQSIKIER